MRAPTVVVGMCLKECRLCSFCREGASGRGRRVILDRMDGMDSTAAATGRGGKCGSTRRGLGALCEEKLRGAKVVGPNGGIKGEEAEGRGMTGEV